MKVDNVEMLQSSVLFTCHANSTAINQNYHPRLDFGRHC